MLKNIVLSVVIIAAALAGRARAAEMRPVDVPAGDLTVALETLAKQSGVEFIYEMEQLKGLKTRGVHGEFTAENAVAKLLEGTKLTVTVHESGAVLISAPMVSGAVESGSKAIKVADGQEGQMPADSKAQGAAAQGKDLNKLEEVVVTAQKRGRAENIKDVPMSISAVSGESLARRGINDVKDLTFAVPSLSFHSFGAGAGFLNIRGIGGERGNAPIIGLYLDEIPAESSGFLNGTNSGLDVRTYDLERVEVLKGPQGTLFGESSLGGLIRYVTNDPKLDRVEGRVETKFFGTKDGDPSTQLVGVINAPLVNDVLGLRIAGTYERNGGWIDQLANYGGPVMRRNINDNSLTDVRAKLLYVPTAALRLSALVDVHRNNVGAVNFVNVHPLEKSEFLQASIRNDPTDAYDHFNIFNLTAEYDLAFATLRSSTSRFDSRIRSGNAQVTTSNLGAADQPEKLGFPDEFLLRPSDEGFFDRVTTEEVRLTSNDTGPLKWLIGGSWKKTRTTSGHNSNYDYYFPTLGPQGFRLSHLGADASGTGQSEILAGFADGSYTFFDRLEIGAGVRAYHENQEGKNFTNDVLTLEQSATFKKTTHRAFVKYRLSDQVNLYANTATGFRRGVLNSQQAIAAGAPAQTEPENSIFYEAGMKGTFFDKKLGLDLAVFRGRYEDFLQGALIKDPNSPAFIGYTDNSGTAKIKGIEWQVDASPVSGLHFSLGGDVLRSVFEKVNPVTAGNAFIVGDPMDFVPKYDITFTADYAFDWSSSVPGFVNVGYSRKGPMQTTNRNTGIGLLLDRTDPIDLLQANLSATKNGFEFTLFVRNILDVRKALNPSWAGAWNQERPRTLGVGVAKSF